MSEAVISSAINHLLSNNLIIEVKRKRQHLVIYLRCGCIDKWVIRGTSHRYSVVDFNKPLLKRPIPINNQYTIEMIENQKLFSKYFVVLKDDLLEAGFLDKKMLVYRITDRIIREGWIDIKHPKMVIKNVVKKPRYKMTHMKVHESMLKFSYRKNDKYRYIYESYYPWHLESVDDKPSVRDAWSNPRIILRTVDALARNNRSISRHSIANHIRRSYKYGPRIIDPYVWRLILEKCYTHFDVKVLDLCPQWGWKLLSFINTDVVYCTNDRRTQKLAEDIDYDIKSDVFSVYNIVFLSNTEPILPEIVVRGVNKYQDSNYVIAVVSKEHVLAVRNKVAPWRIISVYDKPVSILIFKNFIERTRYTIWN